MIRAAFLSLCTINCVSRIANGFTIEDEVAALRRGPRDYAALHGMRLDPILVEASDGWILEVHRIRSISIYNEKHSTPVLLSHGVGCSSLDFMVNPRNESLAFILADHGYDVWAVNYRSNKFSNRVRHNGKIGPPTTNDYFHSSFQHMAERDLPAFLEKIRQVRGHMRLHLIGHSQGCLVHFAFSSQFHEYDDMILSIVAISPGVLGEDTSLRGRLLFAVVPELVRRFTFGPVFDAIMRIRLLATPSDRLNAMIEFASSELARHFPNVFARLLSLSMQKGFRNAVLKQDPHLRKERLPIMLTKFPAGATVLQLYLIYFERYQESWTKLDYRKFPQMHISNQQEYGQDEPPPLNFADIRVRLDIYSTKDDIFTEPGTAMKVIRRYNATVGKIIDVEQMVHIDTVWGWDARCFIYEEIIDSFARQELREGGLGERDQSHTNRKVVGADQDRLDYRLVTVPEFLKTLPFEKACVHRDGDSVA